MRALEGRAKAEQYRAATAQRRRELLLGIVPARPIQATMIETGAGKVVASRIRVLDQSTRFQGRIAGVWARGRITMHRFACHGTPSPARATSGAAEQKYPISPGAATRRVVFQSRETARAAGGLPLVSRSGREAYEQNARIRNNRWDRGRSRVTLNSQESTVSPNKRDM